MRKIDIWNNIGDVITLFDLDLNVIDVSPSVFEFRGFTPAEVLELPIEETISPDFDSIIHKILGEELRLETEGTANTRRFRVLETVIRRKDGSTFPAENRISFSRDPDGVADGIIAVSHDITERKKTEKALRESEKRYRELSIKDDLTQLYNSRYFHDQIKSETERVNRYGQHLTLLMIDLDNFKSFNDAHGHVEGDKVLMRLGQVIKRCLRETDSAYRYGGEEFTIILPMTTSEEGILIAKRIQAELRKEAFCPILDKEIYMTVSIGLAQYKPKEEIKAFVHRVDQIMYKAKKSGKDRVCSESAV